MTKKDSWYVNFIKRCYGVDQINEYQSQELNRILSNAFLMFFIYFLIMMLFMTPSVLTLMFFHSKIAVLILGITIGINFLVFLIICAYVSATASDLHLDDVKVNSEEAYLNKVRKYKKRSIYGGIFMFTVLRLSDIFTSGVNGESMLASLFSPLEIVINAITAILLSVMTYFISKSTIKKI